MINHQKPNLGKSRRKRVYVYFTEEQIERLKIKAEANDLSVSGLIVDVIEHSIDNQTVLDLKFKEGDFK